MVYYAKSPEKDGSQETVQTHLQVVKNLAGEYGKAFGAEKSAELCGLFHDFGKYSPTFQNGLHFCIFIKIARKTLAKSPFAPQWKPSLPIILIW